jgi:hypothetical protein
MATKKLAMMLLRSMRRCSEPNNGPCVTFGKLANESADELKVNIYPAAPSLCDPHDLSIMYFPTIILATLISTFNFVHAAPKGYKKYAFVLTGDSTTAANGGWGDGFCSILAVNTSCANHGKSGATTGTFSESRALDSALADVAFFAKAGKKTLVTVQFGHNDQKIVSPSPD